MRAGAPHWAALLIGCALAATSCQPTAPPPPAPAPPAAAAPPARAATICERPPRPPKAAQDPKVEASFRQFANGWLDKMRKAGAKRPPNDHRLVRDQFETELRPTGNRKAPWVGILRYCEQTARCSGASASTCQVSKGSAVTEIFRFEAGKWVY